MTVNSFKLLSLRTLALGLTISASCFYCYSQTAPAAAPSPVEREHVGDAPDDPGPLATDLSAEIKPKAIDAAMKKVGDWQVKVAEPHFNRQWTFAALYDGLLAASKTTGDPKYHDAVLHFAERSDWTLISNRFPHADDQAFGQAYLDLYLEDKKPVRMADTKATMDRLIVRPDDPDKLLWWWCDALFMSPPVLLRMYEITHDKKYLDYMDHEWWLTSASLYNQENHLYFRDSRYFTQKQANGKPIFWSRGNGWVMGALVNVLRLMPADYPSRPKYVAQFREMAAEIAAIQSADGLWRSGPARSRCLRSAGGLRISLLHLRHRVRNQRKDSRSQDVSACSRKIVEGNAHPHLRGRSARFDSAHRWPTLGSSNPRPAMSTVSAASFSRVRRCIGWLRRSTESLAGYCLHHPNLRCGRLSSCWFGDASTG